MNREGNAPDHQKIFVRKELKRNPWRGHGGRSIHCQRWELSKKNH